MPKNSVKNKWIFVQVFLNDKEKKEIGNFANELPTNTSNLMS